MSDHPLSELWRERQVRVGHRCGGSRGWLAEHIKQLDADSCFVRFSCQAGRLSVMCMSTQASVLSGEAPPVVALLARSCLLYVLVCCWLCVVQVVLPSLLQP